MLAAAEKLKVESALIDGEAVVLDTAGKSNFQALQASLKSGKADLVYFAFDLLELNGEDLKAEPLIERKEKLAKVIGDRQGHHAVIPNTFEGRARSSCSPSVRRAWKGWSPSGPTPAMSGVRCRHMA